MTRQLTYFLIALVQLTTTANTIAQTKEVGYDFVPYDNVLFQDNFNKDLSGTFPKLWETPPNIQKSGWSVKVMEALDGNLLSISCLATKIGTISLEPKMKDLYYLSDSFTLEFECYLENSTSKIDVDFYASSKEEVFKLIFHTIIKKEKKGYFLEYERWFSSDHRERKKLPADFVYNTWHRIAISYINKKLSYYLDESKLLAIPGHDHALTGLLFSFSSAAALRNVRLASGNKREPEPRIERIAAVPLHTITINDGPRSENPLNKILTENKFITHAINFNVNESTIRPESMEFISKLTEFLVANPSVRLEIIGHTDNDGDSTSNIKLSLARANEVKKQLTDQGIENTRLITNGYGDTRPLKANDTPEGKAENRRVEFIRQ